MRRPFALSAILLLALSFGDRLAAAQPARPGARPTPPPAAAPAPTPAPATLPPEPQVDDPMLAPVPRAKTEIGNWEDALKYVRARSTDLRIAAQQVVQAEAQSRIALAGALPTINAVGRYQRELVNKETLPPGSSSLVTLPKDDTSNGSITLAQPVLALRAWYAIGTADHSENVARLSLEDTKRQIALGVANAIVGVVTAERLAELNRVGLKNALTRLELANRKATLGSGTGLDVVRAKQDVETARAQLVNGDESLRQAREALGLALGISDGVGVPPSVDLNGLEASARSSCKPAKSIDERADVASLAESREVAQRQINDAKLQFMPTINLVSVAQSTLDNLGHYPDGTSATYNTSWNIQAVLTIPIWDGGIRYGNLRNAHASEAIAGERLEAARRKAQIEVIQAQRGVSVADDARKVATSARDLAAENDRLTRTAYLEGRGTSLELVTAAQGLREAEITLALREFDLVKARVLAVLALASCGW